MSAEDFAHNVAGTWAALPTKSGASYHAGVGSNRALVDYTTYMAQIEASRMQTGGTAQMSGRQSSASVHMLRQSQEQFAEMIGQSVTPTIIPMPVDGGGGGTHMMSMGGSSTTFPSLPAEDNSVVSMEYKYRITMGASV